MIKLIFSFAIRNLLRARLRTVLALAMITAVFATLLFTQSLMRARNQDIVDTVTNSFLGASQIQKKVYRDEHKLAATLSDDEIANIQKNVPQNLITATRVYVPSLISSASDSLQITMVGVDPAQEAQVTKIPGFVNEGEFLQSSGNCDDLQIIIGTSLAKALKVKLGEKVVLLTQAADQTIGNDLFRVKGIFSSASESFDKSYAFTDIRCARTFSSINGVHEVIFKSQRDLDANLMGLKLDASLALLSWKEKIPEVYRTIKANDVTINLMTAILFFVILLSLINTFLLSLIERTKEFGVMIAIGITPLKIFIMILAEILCVGIVGIALGTAVGSALIAYHQKNGFDLSIFYGETAEFGGFAFNLMIYPAFSFKDYFGLCAVALAFILMAGLYPAILTLRKKPKEIM